MNIDRAYVDRQHYFATQRQVRRQLYEQFCRAVLDELDIEHDPPFVESLTDAALTRMKGTG